MASSDNWRPSYDAATGRNVPMRRPFDRRYPSAVHRHEEPDAQESADAPLYPVATMDLPLYRADTETGRRPRRLAGMAIALALAACFGAVVGVFLPGAIGEKVTVADAGEVSAPIRESIDTLASELAALKTTIAASRRDSEASLTDLSGRFAKVEEAQDGIGDKLAALAEAGVRQASPPPPSPEVTGSVKPAEQPRIAKGWILWRVTNGRAVIEHRGRAYEVEPGSDVPGLGLVDSIERESGRWVVTTRGGVIRQRKS